MPEHDEREEKKPTLAEALKGFEDSPTVEEYKAEFAGQPTPWKNALPSAPPLDDAEREFVRELREYSVYIGGWEDEEGRNWGSASIAVLADKIEAHFASLRAALAAAEKERDEAKIALVRADMEFQEIEAKLENERDAARREAGELRAALEKIAETDLSAPQGNLGMCVAVYRERLADVISEARAPLTAKEANNG